MPYVASVGTYLPCWGAPLQRVAGDDEDAVTMAACKRTSEVKTVGRQGNSLTPMSSTSRLAIASPPMAR